MKTKFIKRMILLSILFLGTVSSLKVIDNSKGSLEDETNSFSQRMKRAKVPVAKCSGKLDNKHAVIYYKLDDNINFQTLFIDPYGSPGVAPPTTILGRFKGKKAKKDKYEIKELEAKIFSLKGRVCDRLLTSNDDRLRIKKISVNNKNKDSIKFKIIITNDTNHVKDDEVDYIYGIHRGERKILVNKNAAISFQVVMDTIVSGSRPVLGGYECDGTGTTGGGG